MFWVFGGIIACLLVWLYNKQQPIKSILMEEDENEQLTNEEKGRQGEEEIVSFLKGLPGKFLLYNNFYLPITEDQNTEIDILMVHEKGIFVFESKNYAGVIEGEAHAHYWTKSFSSTFNQRFYNPIKQNDTHIRALKNLIGHYEVNNIIVFGREATLNVDPIPATDVYVCKVTQLSFLYDLLENLPKQISLDLIKSELDLVDPANWAMKQQHIEKLQARYGHKAIS